MQFYLIIKKMLSGQSPVPKWLVFTQNYLLGPFRPFLMIFFEIVCYFAHCARGILGSRNFFRENVFNLENDEMDEAQL